jgi:heme/copper-type cytochrome/quinol oxidase subunit 4
MSWQQEGGPAGPGGMDQGPPMEPHRGTMILVFGILGIVCCVIFGILAWVMGNGDLEKMKAGMMDPTGEGLTNAGRILGMISVVLAIIGVILIIIQAVVAASLGVPPSGY